MADLLRVSADPCIVTTAILLRMDPDLVDRQHSKAQVLADLNRATERFRNPDKTTARIFVVTTTHEARVAAATDKLLD